MQQANNLRVEVDDLHVWFPDRRGVHEDVHALRGVSLDVRQGEILAVVGESGSGKTVLGLSLLGLLQGDPPPRTSGHVRVSGVDMLSAGVEDKRDVRRNSMGAVFQDAMTSLNPTMRVGEQVLEVVESTSEAAALLDRVGVPQPERRMRAFPHELSGGLRQRIMIAMAIARRPALVIADEPTTALDMTVQAQILELLHKLRSEIGCAFLLITHDFGVASQIADRVAVLYGGRLAELGPMGEVVASPAHPYTAALLRSRLGLDSARDRQLQVIEGEPPDPKDPPPGCPFAPRCEHRIGACDLEPPDPQPAGEHSGVTACIVSGAGNQGRGSLSVQNPKFRTPHSDSRLVVQGEGLGKDYRFKLGLTKSAKLVALRNVSLEVFAGECLAIVGESGSGKSTLLRVIAGLVEPDRGRLDLFGEAPQMVFQDAGASLTPWLRVGEIVGERLPRSISRQERKERINEGLIRVGLSPRIAAVKTIKLSGGQKQRVAFARATIIPPSLLLCDEPTSALDTSLASVVLNLIQELRRELGMGVIFVTHDLAAARYVADRVAVMYLGEFVETGLVQEVVVTPRHPYTKALVSAIPSRTTSFVRLTGEPASPLSLPSGCPFHPRCPERVETCVRDKPELVSLSGDPEREVACVHHD